MDIKEIIEDVLKAGGVYRECVENPTLPNLNCKLNSLNEIKKFAELTLKRASLSENELQAKLSQAEAEKAELVEAAKAVVDRWHTPLWKDAPHTAEFINRLENALKDNP